MAASAGRAPDDRPVIINTTAGSPNITFASNVIRAQPNDAGRTIIGPGLPPGTRVIVRINATSGVLSNNATVTGVCNATLIGGPAAQQAYGFVGWSPESDAEAGSHTATHPGRHADQLLDSTTRVSARDRAPS